MKLSLKWLKALLGQQSKKLPVADQIATGLDLSGTAVDGIASTAPAYTNVVVGQVISQVKHPDSDHLWLATVNAGSDPALQIVCGAQNFAKSDYVAVALVGAVLPGGFKIKRSKIRGQESQGMLCSESELGLASEKSPGIMRLQETIKGLSAKSLGAPLEAVLSGQMGSDPIIDLEITPNRPDCMSVVGLAREVAAIYQIDVPYRKALPELHYPSPELGDVINDEHKKWIATSGSTKVALESSSDFASSALVLPPRNDVGHLVQIKIEDDARCSRFVVFVIRNVKIGPSPAWLQERVQACGTRSINNVVDVTNYIMYELGQPLHAYDFDTFVPVGSDPKLKSVTTVCIGVRAAKDGEKFTTLDKVERELDGDISVIFDGNAKQGAGQTIGLAGVMGGLDSEVTDATTNILLEAAVFDAAHTSRTARKLKLFSEASARFERGVDPAQTLDCGRRAAEMIAVLAGGELAPGYVEAGEYEHTIRPIRLIVKELNYFLGVAVPPKDIVKILESIGCSVSTQKQGLSVVPPSFRPDLTRPADLYEEVLRLHGMNKVKGVLPINPVPNQQVLMQHGAKQSIVSTLLHDGFDEIMTYSFASESSLDLVAKAGDDSLLPLQLVNPINLEEPYLRKSLMPRMLEAVVTNQNQSISSIKLFEIGTVFADETGLEHPLEEQSLAIALNGDSRDESELNWASQASPLSFYDLKGAAEDVLVELNINSVQIAPLSPTEAEWLQPGAAAGLFTKALPGKFTNSNGHLIGWLGQLHQSISQQYDIKGDTFIAEIEIAPLLMLMRQTTKFKELAKYPSVVLDVSFECPANLSHADLEAAIQKNADKTLESVQLFDVFADSKKLGVDKKAYTYRLTYRSASGSLEQVPVQASHQAMIDKVASKLGLSVR